MINASRKAELEPDLKNRIEDAINQLLKERKGEELKEQRKVEEEAPISKVDAVMDVSMDEATPIPPFDPASSIIPNNNAAALATTSTVANPASSVTSTKKERIKWDERLKRLCHEWIQNEIEIRVLQEYLKLSNDNTGPWPMQKNIVELRREFCQKLAAMGSNSSVWTWQEISREFNLFRRRKRKPIETGSSSSAASSSKVAKVVNSSNAEKVAADSTVNSAQ